MGLGFTLSCRKRACRVASCMGERLQAEGTRAARAVPPRHARAHTRAGAPARAGRAALPTLVRRRASRRPPAGPKRVCAGLKGTSPARHGPGALLARGAQRGVRSHCAPVFAGYRIAGDGARGPRADGRAPWKHGRAPAGRQAGRRRPARLAEWCCVLLVRVGVCMCVCVGGGGEGVFVRTRASGTRSTCGIAHVMCVPATKSHTLLFKKKT